MSLMHRWRRPSGCVGLCFQSADAARAAAVNAATGRTGAEATPLDSGQIALLWHSLEKQGWRIEEVTPAESAFERPARAAMGGR